MKSISKNIFLKTPAFLQNIALSLYGLKIQHIRYGGDYNNCLTQVKYQRELNDSEMKNYLNAALRNMICNAVTNVPYYKELFRKEKIAHSDIKSIDDLYKIPLLDKSFLRENSLNFVSTKFNKKKLLCLHTTGTTGTPLNIYCDNLTRQRNYAFYNHFLEANNINFKGRRATFGGRIVVPVDQKKPPFWRYSYFQKNIIFSSYHITDHNIPYYIDKLKIYQPDYIDAYPSSLYFIAKYAYKKNINLKNITKGITTSAETLFQDQREIIESVFNIPVCDQYGAAEMCIFVGQCTEGCYHIHSDYGIIEILDKNGKNVFPGDVGEVVCTGLINHVMPLIRYRIGDMAVLGKKKCRCGSLFPVMEKIMGRMDDVIVTPDGKNVGRLSPVLKGFPIKEAQYVQKITEEVTVLIVRDAGYSSDTDKLVVKELMKRLGGQIKIQIVHVTEIPRSAGNKFKSIVSEI